MDIHTDFISGLKQIGSDAALITSSVSITYLSGFYGLEGVLLICSSGKKYCLTDPRYSEAAAARLAPLDFTVLIPEKNDHYAKVNEICISENVKVLGLENDFLSLSDHEKIKNKIKCGFLSVSSLLSDLRASKTPYEIDCIKKAQRIAEKALNKLLGEIRPRMTENECKARLEYYMALLGSERPAFDTIFISGKKTSMPHGRPDEKKISKGEFITVDFGAQVNGYVSDMTRTFCISKPSVEMEKIYDTVLKAQIAGCNAAKAGISGKEIDKAARDIIKDAGYGDYFGHSLGHGVGLMVHEKPAASPLSDCIINEGAVLTIEPGIYIPGFCGVRIEDMMYLSEKENINLTNFPKNLIII